MFSGGCSKPPVQPEKEDATSATEEGIQQPIVVPILSCVSCVKGRHMKREIAKQIYRVGLVTLMCHMTK